VLLCAFAQLFASLGRPHAKNELMEPSALEHVRFDSSVFEALFHRFDEAFIGGRLEKSAEEFDVGLVVSHGQSGGWTKSARNNQNRFAAGSFSNDIGLIEIHWHDRFSLSLFLEVKQNPLH
jgi:hypothetical protein